MRLKFGQFDRDNPDSLKCCVCLHVRTGTILLGIFHLFIHILVLSFFAVVCLHPELVKDLPSDVQTELDSAYGTSLNHDNSTYSERFGYSGFFRKKTWDSEDKFLALLITVGSFVITLMLVYGAIKCRPGYLMPFFCLQVFDFCVSCLTVVGYFSYIPDIKRWITAQKYLPWREQLLAVDDDWLMLMAVMFFVLILTVKAYFIGIVWTCYKYLSTCERTITTRGVLRTYSGGETAGEDSEMLLPPKYEDVIAMPLEDEPQPAQEQPPPPPYSAN